MESLPPPIIRDQLLRDIVAGLIAIIAVILVTLLVRYFISRSNSKTTTPTTPTTFSDIMRTGDTDPSLSRFQFLLWTWVITFAFTFIYFVRILGGDSNPPAGGIPFYALSMIGISTGVPIISSVISNYLLEDIVRQC